MKEIKFNKTSNIFINSGIIALYQYLQLFKENNSSYNYSFKLEKDSLIIKCDNIFQLLEEIYYFMGKEIYDTSGKKAREKAEKFYFIKKPFKAVPFYKMKTYGLGELITNDPQPTPRKPEDAVYFKDIKETDLEFANKIADFYIKNNLKLKFYKLSKANNKLIIKYDKDQKGDSRIFLNQSYTKTSSIDFDIKYFEMGNERCSLTGECYKKLADTINTSPFLSGLPNFESYLSHSSRKISWKAMYLCRFSPKLCLYSYVNGLDTLICYLFNSDNLINLNTLYEFNRSFYKDEIQLIEDNYMSNFNLYKFHSKKDNEHQKESSKDYVWQSEILFMIIFSVYRKFLFTQGIEDINNTNDDFDPMRNMEFDNIPISLIYFKSDKFASTIRPNTFEYYNNFKFIIRLMCYLEKNHILFNELLSSLKFLKRSDKNSQNSYRLERKLRNTILEKILKLQSILDEIEWLFYNCYVYSIANEYIGFKNYKMLLELVNRYEPIIKYGGNEYMNPEIQEKAVKLGSSIGMGIINYENPININEKILNAKKGRKYIININKSRTLQQFLDEIIRIQNKYSIVVSSELLNNIDENNWEYIKRFSLISALNNINSTINSVFNKKGESNETK